MDFSEIELEDIYKKSKVKAVSCGFLIIDSNTGKMLAAHATGSPDNFHDILKGHLEPGETYLQAALRELKEESGIVLNDTDSSIVDCGLFKYTKDKDLYVFKAELPIQLETLHCDSMFTDKDGNEKPEMDGYELTDDVSRFYGSLQPIIRKVLI